jgi:hypothetical protein
MPDTDASTGAGGIETREEPTVSEAIRSTEAYQTEMGVVFYDSQNPLAWIQTDGAVDLESVA